MQQALAMVSPSQQETPSDPVADIMHPEHEMKRMGIPARYLFCSLENFTGNDRLIDHLRGVIDGPPVSVFICGACGCGKTHLAASIIRRLIQTGRIRENKVSVKFASVVDLLMEVKATFNQRETEEDVLSQYVRPMILVLDDLGAEKQSEWAAMTIYALIDRRYRDMKTTIVTSNMTLEQIEQQLGSRTASRLAEYEIVIINMPDYRKKK